jgi:hypothetical protein
MPQSEQVKIAGAIVDVINAADWTLPLTALRHWVHDIDAEELTENRRVVVLPPADDDSIESVDINGGRRGHMQLDFPMRLVYQSRVSRRETDFEGFIEKCDTEAYTVETLWQTFAFDNYELTAIQDGQKRYWVVDAQIRKACDTDQLRQGGGIYEAEVLVTVRVWRRS